MEFLNIKNMMKFIELACKQYSNGPAWFTNWLEDLYLRAQDDLKSITLDEICTLAMLHCDDDWKPEPLAVNLIYKLFDRLGRDTSGILGY